MIWPNLAIFKAASRPKIDAKDDRKRPGAHFAPIFRRTNTSARDAGSVNHWSRIRRRHKPPDEALAIRAQVKLPHFFDQRGPPHA